MEAIVDFFQRNFFVFEIMICYVPYIPLLKSDKNTWWKLLIAAAVLIGYSCLPIARYSGDSQIVSNVLSMLSFLSIFVISLVGIFLSFKSNFWVCILCGISAYLTQHIFFRVRMLTLSLLQEYGVDFEWVNYCYYWGELIAVNIICWFCTARSLQKRGNFKINNKRLLMVALLLWGHMSVTYKEVFEGAMVCLICPTATAAAVITGKLGGSVSALTTYTLLSNILTAVAVPLLFPLVEPHADLSFVGAFLKILSKVFPLLLCPFIAALLIRRFLPKLHLFLLNLHNAAFYLWAVALTIVTAQTFKSLFQSDASVQVEIWIALAGLITCAVQFLLGKQIGTHYHDRTSAGQALGQKNTVLAIWMSYTYLDPLSSVAPGSYVLWQNIINSYQLWKKRKKEAGGNQ